jgi:hypothetical protein
MFDSNKFLIMKADIFNKNRKKEFECGMEG